MSRILDEQDRDRIQETIDSPGYALIVERMREMEARGLANLVNAKEWPEACRTQGAILAWKTALDLPRIMMAGIEPEKRGKRG